MVSAKILSERLLSTDLVDFTTPRQIISYKYQYFPEIPLACGPIIWSQPKHTLADHITIATSPQIQTHQKQPSKN